MHKATVITALADHITKLTCYQQHSSQAKCYYSDAAAHGMTSRVTSGMHTPYFQQMQLHS
jgi:hypothetical protein